MGDDDRRHGLRRRGAPPPPPGGPRGARLIAVRLNAWKQGGLAVALLFCAAHPVPAGAAAPVVGRWLTEGGKALVEIGPCGAAVCGRIARVIMKTDGPATDRNNPDPKLRARPITGLAILTGFTDAGKVWKGRIYDPESGRSYRSELVREGAVLKVKGCFGPFCRTQSWRRAP